jgi:hypothetical protein
MYYSPVNTAGSGVVKPVIMTAAGEKYETQEKAT